MYASRAWGAVAGAAVGACQLISCGGDVVIERETGGPTGGGTITTTSTSGGGGTPDTPSCTGLAASCGPGKNADCCASSVVPGGKYHRSYDGEIYVDMGNPATVDSFRLDTYEVTVGRFRAFVNAGMGTQVSPPASGTGAHPKIGQSGWQAGWSGLLEADSAALRAALKCNASYSTWTDAAAGNETLPVNCVSWYEAFAFCAWDGGRLPTEAEWNYAAAGGSEQRMYPWGSGIDASYAVYDCIGDGQSGCSFADILPVGSKPKGNGMWGHADLGGSMWEWNLDWHAGYPNPCNDCANLNPTYGRVVRGGDFRYSDLLCGYRFAFGDPSERLTNQGLRCARTP